jgi:hypothetical protein
MGERDAPSFFLSGGKKLGASRHVTSRQMFISNIPTYLGMYLCFVSAKSIVWTLDT